jgi:DNA-binding transcriptional LysR family regulator
MDFRTIETFVCVAEQLSFRKAADRLNATQPAISQRIARLEDDLGAKLLERDSRGIALTAPGRAMLDYARRILTLRDELTEAVGGACALSGVVRLGTAETLVHTWLPDFVREANAQYPRLRLEMDVDISSRLIERLVASDIDLAFMVGPVTAPDVASCVLSEYPVAFVGSPSREWHDKPVPLSELATCPIVTFPRKTLPFHAVDELFRNAGLDVRIHASASLATATRMAADGSCVAVIPPVIVQSQIDRGELRVLNVEAHVPKLTFVAAWLEGRPSRAVSGLVGLARQTSAASNRVAS